MYYICPLVCTFSLFLCNSGILRPPQALQAPLDFLSQDASPAVKLLKGKCLQKDRTESMEKDKEEPENGKCGE